MNNNIKLPCGINKDGEVVYIENAVNGLACDCICPGCRQPLVAKNNGKIKEHHFAHISKDFDCEHGYQSAIHYMAKDVFLKLNELIFIKNEKIERYPIDDVQIEQRLDNVIPDILVTSDGKQFIVEIYVTHAVDDEKKAKIKSMMISAVEIDISHLKGLMIDKETLQQEISNPENYSWVYDADDDLVEKKKTCLEDFGLKCKVDFSANVDCPLVNSLTKNIALKFFVPYNICKECYNHGSYNNERYITCGFSCTKEINDLEKRYISEKILCNSNKVLFNKQSDEHKKKIIDLISNNLKFYVTLNSLIRR